MLDPSFAHELDFEPERTNPSLGPRTVIRRHRRPLSPGEAALRAGARACKISASSASQVTSLPMIRAALPCHRRAGCRSPRPALAVARSWPRERGAGGDSLPVAHRLRPRSGATAFTFAGPTPAVLLVANGRRPGRVSSRGRASWSAARAHAAAGRGAADPRGGPVRLRAAPRRSPTAAATRRTSPSPDVDAHGVVGAPEEVELPAPPRARTSPRCGGDAAPARHCSSPRRRAQRARRAGRRMAPPRRRGPAR